RYRSAHANRSRTPSGADTKATAWILPGGDRIRLHSPVGPKPPTVCSAHVSLYRDPVGACSENRRDRKGHLEYGVVNDVRLSGRAVNLCAREAAGIVIKEKVKVIRRASSARIFASCVHFGDRPRLA